MRAPKLTRGCWLKAGHDAHPPFALRLLTDGPVNKQFPYLWQPVNDISGGLPRYFAPVEDHLQRLPHLNRAVVPIEKLRDYALDMNHPLGRPKATAFKSLLGIEREHAEVLGQLIQATLHRALAQPGNEDEYGQRWTTYHHIVGLSGQSAVVTVAWIFKSDSNDVPVLLSCYIEVQQQERLLKLLGL